MQTKITLSKSYAQRKAFRQILGDYSTDEAVAITSFLQSSDGSQACIELWADYLSQYTLKTSKTPVCKYLGFSNCSDLCFAKVWCKLAIWVSPATVTIVIITVIQVVVSNTVFLKSIFLWGDDPILTSYFSNGLVQPPTSHFVSFCCSFLAKSRLRMIAFKLVDVWQVLSGATWLLDVKWV